MPTPITVNTESDLNTAITQLDGTTAAGNYTIDLAQNITLATALDALNLHSGVTVTINGDNGTGGTFALDGNSTQRGLFVYAGTVTIENLVIQHTKAQGGNGASGGGGGAGLGGGLFVAGPTQGAGGGAVTLINVGFVSDNAAGGAGGSGLSGGGGGMGGNGAKSGDPLNGGGGGGGGGGVGLGANGGVGGVGLSGFGSGVAGIVIGASSGGKGSTGGSGGINGGGGGGARGGDGGGGGGVGGGAGSGGGGVGGFGGGGGGASGNSTGGKGGFGGGGGAGGRSNTAGAGGGGFGGGGGSSGGSSGVGGFGAGNAQSDAGGGGLGAGGDIFVQQGGSLTIETSSLGIGTVTAGAGAAGTINAGKAFGSGIFLQGNETITIGAGQTIGQATTISGVIADQTGSGGIGLKAGAGHLIIGGAGTVALSAANTFTGGTTIDAGALLSLGTVGSAGSGTITFAAGSNATLGLAGAALTSNKFANTVTGFVFGDTVDLQGLTFVSGATASVTSGTVTVQSGTVTDTVILSGITNGAAFRVTQDSGTGTDLTLLCFCEGTLIDTPNGEVQVEKLAIGDIVATITGTRCVTWIGRGKVLATRGQRGPATPVIVRKGALADNVPHVDLRVTKGHAFYLDGVLIPVEFLVNHRTILWDDRAQEVALYHVELDQHDVLLANGAPAESYRDDGNRWLFQNARDGSHLPTLEPCAPALTGGPIVDAVWERLLERAGPRKSMPMTDDPDLHLMVDGVRIDVAATIGSARLFRLPAKPNQVRIVSRDVVPAEWGLARDPRSLGVALRRITVRQGSSFVVFDAADGRLSTGFHAYEAMDRLRWTNGDATLPDAAFAAFSGPLEVVLTLAGATVYPDFGYRTPRRLIQNGGRRRVA